VAQPEPRLEPDLTSLERPENNYAAMLPCNLTELERICREEREKLPKYRCTKLVAETTQIQVCQASTVIPKKT
jgi:hypothetical protein